jgi:hypothetical protein
LKIGHTQRCWIRSLTPAGIYRHMSLDELLAQANLR